MLREVKNLQLSESCLFEISVGLTTILFRGDGGVYDPVNQGVDEEAVVQLLDARGTACQIAID
jgi:hypothetical protein